MRFTAARVLAVLPMLMLAALVLVSGPALADQGSAPASATDRVLSGPPEGDDAPLAARELRVSGTALKPRTTNVDYTVGAGGGCVYVTAGNSSTVWNTPLYLPQGATINSFRVYYDDTSGTDLFAWITVYDLYGAVVDEWVVTSTGTGGNGFQNSAAINHVVDYALYSYVVNYRPNVVGATLQFCGVRIFYTD